jgi:cold shock CspA family protein
MNTPRLTGTVRDVHGPHIFIRPTDGSADLYAHRRDLSEQVDRTAHIGMPVTFTQHGVFSEIDQGKRPWAMDVQAL